MRNYFLIALLAGLILISCKKDDPSPSSNNPGGGGPDDTIVDPSVACDESYEDVTLKGHNFQIPTYLPCHFWDATDSIYIMYILGKYNHNYSDAMFRTGGIVGYDKYNNNFSSDREFMPTAETIINAVNTDGYYRLPQVQFNNGYIEFDSTIKVGYRVGLDGYDPDTHKAYSSRSTNIKSTDEFYFQIDHIHKLNEYDPYYNIIGKKKILLRRTENSLTMYDTLTSTFNTAITLY